VVGNDALTVPADTSSIHPGWGIRIALLDAQGDLIANNVIAGNANIGVLGIALSGSGSRATESPTTGSAARTSRSRSRAAPTTASRRPARSAART
jgi:hypothetical protein